MVYTSDEDRGKPSGAASGMRISYGDYDIEVISEMLEEVVEVMVEIMGRDTLTCRLQTRGGTSKMERAFEEKGVFEEKAEGLHGEGQGSSRRRPRVFKDKAGGLLRTQ
ncbi:hypothetical protein Tco_0840041 [Tanacetum coccineum]|uniref:Uncharacterized protein n=1 Tax=Tanacetum coccineum TaxID=301880 RepID=A0ABQ5AWV8_9ASTR